VDSGKNIGRDRCRQIGPARSTYGELAAALPAAQCTLAAMLSEQFDFVRFVALCRNVERCFAGSVLCIQIGAEVNQLLHHVEHFGVFCSRIVPAAAESLALDHLTYAA
jgi:hypothetical protein